GDARDQLALRGRRLLLESLPEPVLELLERDRVPHENEVPAELRLDRCRYLVQREAGGDLLEGGSELLTVDAAQGAAVARRDGVSRLLAGDLLEARPRADLRREPGRELLARHEDVRHEAARRALLAELRHRGLVGGAHVCVARRRARRPEQRLLAGELARGLIAGPPRGRDGRLRAAEVGSFGLPPPPVGGAGGDAAAPPPPRGRPPRPRLP